MLTEKTMERLCDTSIICLTFAHCLFKDFNIYLNGNTGNTRFAAHRIPWQRKDNIGQQNSHQQSRNQIRSHRQ